MSSNKRVKIRALKKTGVLDEDRFFRLWSEQCNYVDPEILKTYWMGLVRATTKELRASGCVAFPHMGMLTLLKQKTRGIWKTKVPGRQWKLVMKFILQDKWRRYFDNILMADPNAILDPREKLLHMDVEAIEQDWKDARR